MAKNGKKESAFVGDTKRCGICGTSLTLYPKDFAPCPHCGRVVCRQCWGAVWVTKAFAAENCSHIAENDGRTMTAVGEPRKAMNWDWPRLLFGLLLGALAIGIVFFLFNLFIF